MNKENLKWERNKHKISKESFPSEEGFKKKIEVRLSWSIQPIKNPGNNNLFKDAHKISWYYVFEF